MKDNTWEKIWDRMRIMIVEPMYRDMGTLVSGEIRIIVEEEVSSVVETEIGQEMWRQVYIHLKLTEFKN